MRFREVAYMARDCQANGANTERDAVSCGRCFNNKCFWWTYYRLPLGCSLRKSWYANDEDDVKHLAAHEYGLGLIEFLEGA